MIAVNLRTLIPRCSGDGRFIEQLLNSFAQELPRLLDAIALSMRTSDLAAATQHAHALKGTAANLSVDQVAKWSAELEAHLRAGDAPKAQQMLMTLRSNCDAAVAAICNAARAVRPAA